MALLKSWVHRSIEDWVLQAVRGSAAARQHNGGILHHFARIPKESSVFLHRELLPEDVYLKFDGILIGIQ